MLRSQYAVLAEFARQGQRSTFDLLGIFDRITAASLPAQHPQMVLLFLLVADSEDDLGPHDFSLRFEAPNGRLLAEQRAQFEVRPEAGTWLGSARLQFQMQNTPLPERGRYWFRLRVGDREVASHPLTVTTVQA